MKETAKPELRKSRQSKYDPTVEAVFICMSFLVTGVVSIPVI
jgi:hypothetical protein